jgi:hypothetical protein
MGQSNLFALAITDADNVYDPSGTGPLLPGMDAALVSYLGLAGAAILYSSSGTDVVGNGIYANSANAGASAGSWLDNPNTISGGTANLPSQLADPSAWIPPTQWTWGSPDGTTFESWVTALPAQQKADVCSLLFIWHENDSGRTYAEKSVWKAAWQRFISLVRGEFGITTPALMPVFDCTPMPSVGNAGGHAMVYEAVCELAADPSNALYIALPQMADCDPSTIAALAGSNHTNYTSYLDFSTRASFFMGRTLDSLASISRIPAAMGTGAGPVISGASLSGNVVTVTVTHDAGTALVLNGDANTGAGWSVLDQSYSPDLPGTAIPATAVAIVNATTFTITLAWVPISAAGARLHYPWGNNRIGYGDAITDNRSSLTFKPGIDGASSTAGSALGTSMPIQRPITISSGVAMLGIPLAKPYVAPSVAYGFNTYEIDGSLPIPGSYTHGSGTITCIADDLSTSGYTSPHSVEFGFTSNPGVAPSSWVPGGNYQTTLWSAYVPTPATAGTYYAWQQSLDASGNVVQRAAGPAFTVN